MADKIWGFTVLNNPPLAFTVNILKYDAFRVLIHIVEMFLRRLTALGVSGNRVPDHREGPDRRLHASATINPIMPRPPAQFKPASASAGTERLSAWTPLFGRRPGESCKVLVCSQARFLDVSRDVRRLL